MEIGILSALYMEIMNIPKSCGLLGKILVEIGLEEDQNKKKLEI
jgi:ubiquinone biosynthesis protein Coq4